jgi:hypothetical protein
MAAAHCPAASEAQRVACGRLQCTGLGGACTQLQLVIGVHGTAHYPEQALQAVRARVTVWACLWNDATPSMTPCSLRI